MQEQTPCNNGNATQPETESRSFELSTQQMASTEGIPSVDNSKLVGTEKPSVHAAPAEHVPEAGSSTSNEKSIIHISPAGHALQVGYSTELQKSNLLTAHTDHVPEMEKCPEKSSLLAASAENVHQMGRKKSIWHSVHEEQTQPVSTINLASMEHLASVKHIPPVSFDIKSSLNTAPVEHMPQVLDWTQPCSQAIRECSNESESFDLARQSYHNEQYADDEEILREIDSCLESRKLKFFDDVRKAAVETTGTTTVVDRLKNSEAIIVTSGTFEKTTETKTDTEKSQGADFVSTWIGPEVGTSELTTADNESFNKTRPFDVTSQQSFTYPEPSAWTAAVIDITVSDTQQTSVPNLEIISDMQNSKAGNVNQLSPPGAHDPSLHAFISSGSDTFEPSSAVQTQKQTLVIMKSEQPESFTTDTCEVQPLVRKEQRTLRESAKCSEQLKPNLEMVKMTGSGVCKSGCVCVKPSEPASSHGPLQSYVGVDQDSFGRTEMSISLVINTDCEKKNRDTPDGGPLSHAISTVLRPCMLNSSAALTEQAADAVAEISAGRDFLMNCVSLSVPRKQILEISFEPVVQSVNHLGDKDIEVEVAAERGSSARSINMLAQASVENRSASGEKNATPVDDTDLDLEVQAVSNAACIHKEVDLAENVTFPQQFATCLPLSVGLDEISNSAVFSTTVVTASTETLASVSMLSDLAYVQTNSNDTDRTYVSTFNQNIAGDVRNDSDCEESQEILTDNKEEVAGRAPGKTKKKKKMILLDNGFVTNKQTDGKTLGLEEESNGEQSKCQRPFNTLAAESCVKMVSPTTATASRTMPVPVTNTSAQETRNLGFLLSKVDETLSVTDDSDDSLSDGPDFLFSAVHDPGLLTTHSTNNSGQDGQSLAGGKKPSQSYHSAQQSTTFSLDSLLTDTKKAEAEENEILAVQAELRKDLLSNRGIGALTEENEAEEVSDEDFTDEQKHTLMMLRLDEDHIQESHPGEPVLSHHNCGQLFTQSISPAACGVIASNDTCLGKLLSEYQPDMLMDILSSDILSLAYDSLPCKNEVQRWLFFIMSVHSNAMEVQKCGDQLLQALQWQMEGVLQGKEDTPYFWIPQISDILQIFLNWGASEKDLVFDASTMDLHMLGEMLPLHQPVMEPLAPSNRNFGPVLKMLSCWLQARPSYSTQELNQLLLMLCKLSLDTSVCKKYVLYELQICVASILDCYEASQWKQEVPWLCRKLSTLNNHHHNQVFITQLFTPTCPRGRYLQQRLSFLLLYTALTHKDLSDEKIHNFQLLDLCEVIPGLKHLLQSDNYHLASLIHLLDLSVGPAALHITQRKQLHQLLQAVRLIVSEIRDSMQRLDCTKVKGMLLHMCLKWDLAVKASNTRQRKIFSCFPSKTCVQAEQLEDQGLQCSDDDAADGSTVSDDLNEQGFTASCGKRQKIEDWWTEGEKKKKEPGGSVVKAVYGVTDTDRPSKETCFEETCGVTNE